MEEVISLVCLVNSFPSFVRSNELELSELSLIPTDTLPLASTESLTVTSSHRSILYERALEHLPSLFTYYKNLLHINQSLITINISDIHVGNFFQLDESFRLTIHYSNPMIDITWPYGLLSSLYTNAISIAEDDKRLDVILNSLRFVYILEMKRCGFFQKMLTITTRFSMIAGIYLLGSDVFLEKNIAEYLLAFLHCFNEQNLLQKLQTNTSVQSLMTFFDL